MALKRGREITPLRVATTFCQQHPRAANKLRSDQLSKHKRVMMNWDIFGAF
jgi:hypothetical protein